MANGITRYSLHPEIVQLIFGQLLSNHLQFLYELNCLFSVMQNYYPNSTIQFEDQP